MIDKDPIPFNVILDELKNENERKNFEQNCNEFLYNQGIVPQKPLFVLSEKHPSEIKCRLLEDNVMMNLPQYYYDFKEPSNDQDIVLKNTIHEQYPIILEIDDKEEEEERDEK